MFRRAAGEPSEDRELGVIGREKNSSAVVAPTDGDGSTTDVGGLFYFFVVTDYRFISCDTLWIFLPNP